MSGKGLADMALESVRAIAGDRRVCAGRNGGNSYPLGPGPCRVSDMSLMAGSVCGACPVGVGCPR